MKFAQSVLLVLALWISAAVEPVCAQEPNVVRLTSLEWPPYSGQALRQQGATAAVIRAAFSAVGYRVEIEYFPWARAVRMAREESHQYHGYFPEYFDQANTEDFIYSSPVGSGPLGFAEHAANPIIWSSYEDLQKFKIGVVLGYLNTPKFDAMVSKGLIKTDVAPNDLSNLQKLEAGRIDLAVIDRFVFEALKRTAPQLADKKQNLAFNPRLLDEKALFVCFRKGSEGQRLERDLARGLKKINVQAIIAAHLQTFRD